MDSRCKIVSQFYGGISCWVCKISRTSAEQNRRPVNGSYFSLRTRFTYIPHHKPAIVQPGQGKRTDSQIVVVDIDCFADFLPCLFADKVNMVVNSVAFPFCDERVVNIQVARRSNRHSIRLDEHPHIRLRLDVFGDHIRRYQYLKVSRKRESGAVPRRCRICRSRHRHWCSGRRRCRSCPYAGSGSTGPRRSPSAWRSDNWLHWAAWCLPH